MRILLDTHIWLWMVAARKRLSDRMLAAIEEPTNELFLSAASAWEIAIKHSTGRLSLPESPASYVPKRMADTGVSALVVEHVHALAVAGLPRHHDDPFDRLLIAQAIVERLPVLTVDRQFAAYAIELIV